MPVAMRPRPKPDQRGLTAAERAGLPAGLLAAIDVETVVLTGAPHPLVSLRKSFSGKGSGDLILVRGARIFWPGLPEDLSLTPARLALLAHELTHVWQYQTGMTVWRYLWREMQHLPQVYAYRLVPCKAFIDYGYEQQAAMVEDWVRLRFGLPRRWGAASVDAAALEALIPFADRRSS